LTEKGSDFKLILIKETKKESPKMQLNQAGKLIQDKFENYVNKFSNILPKPYFKCLKETMKAMLVESTPNVRKIAMSMPGDVSLKKKQERITYHLDKDKTFEDLNNAFLMCQAKKITSDSVIIIDESDIIKPCAKKMEHLSKVRDGSTGAIENGYYSFNSTIVNQDNIGGVDIHPLYSYIYANDVEPESKNDRLCNFLVDLTIYSENKGILTFDRGYDDRKLIHQLCDQENDFVIRAMDRRDLLVDGKKVKFKEVTKNISLEYDYKSPNGRKKFIYGLRKVRVITDPHPLKNPNSVEVWLVVSRYGKKGGLFYSFANFKNKMLDEESLGKKVLETYAKRWKIEEQFRHVKQDMNLEKIQLLVYQRIKSMNLWITILMGFIYACKRTLLKADKPFMKHMMDHKKDYTVLNGFAYYRIFILIKKIFQGIIFRKRDQYKRKKVIDDRQETLESYFSEFFGVC